MSASHPKWELGTIIEWDRDERRGKIKLDGKGWIVEGSGLGMHLKPRDRVRCKCNELPNGIITARWVEKIESFDSKQTELIKSKLEITRLKEKISSLEQYIKTLEASKLNLAMECNKHINDLTVALTDDKKNMID